MVDPTIMGALIAAASSGITALVILAVNSSTARRQNDIAHSGLLLSLFDKRFAWVKSVSKAVHDRNEEIIKTDFNASDLPNEALTRFWEIRNEGKVLFGDDIKYALQEVEELMRRKGSTLCEIRTNPDYDRGLHKVVGDDTLAIYAKLDEISELARDYIDVGDIRRKPRSLSLEAGLSPDPYGRPLKWPSASATRS